MKIGVIRYPGTNCFYDTMRYFNDHDCIEIWYKNDVLNDNIDLLINIRPGVYSIAADTETDPLDYAIMELRFDETHMEAAIPPEEYEEEAVAGIFPTVHGRLLLDQGCVA